MSSELSTILTFDLKQLVAIITAQTDQALQAAQASRAPAVESGLTLLTNSVQRLNRQVTQLEDDHNNLVALADTSQVINSSLELNDVLRIVMDTIVHLTGAERGFLMLR